MTRAIIRLTGTDPAAFLQGLVTNDTRRLAPQTPLYAALLSPQGKYLADFFLVQDGDSILLDVAAPLADDLFKRLSMYKLRTPVTLERVDLPVSRGTGPAPDGAVPDPRHPALGWRLYGQALADDGTDWDALRVAHCIPEAGVELVPNETFILEAGFPRLNGVDFRKGCYVGQEVTARMHHKTELRKGLVTVPIRGAAPIGTAIMAGGKAAGQLFTQSGDRAIAYLRFDRAQPGMLAGDAVIDWPQMQS
ncbi:YgfZ/GcvT domain-containing protein [Roseinatronobacter alkalisoli]|uniref:Folate-binding protein n=1 Tax=Roseinatronobacter alkalisoli TaxID=3028235 RepID=A0ABT5T8U8_9RHOB|nr:folate-binding protein [Roseinatronobacter sp. HJB301]MDD7971549.1 folate-binding protein [Roseinatronobacter sp. HJB301]